MKKIICIGGTSRSGSTLLDLILSNDKNAMSLGEIESLFSPTRKHHFIELNKIKKDTKWSIILKDGKKNLYENLVKHFPNIDVFVDSSKNPFWFKYQLKNGSESYEIENVLIHKKPAELASSYIKRGMNTEWIRVYENYHRKYFSLIKNYTSIRYKNLVTDDGSLEKLCEKIGINYFSEKKDYWKSEQNTFFGSNSVKSNNSNNKKRGQLKRQSRKDVKYDGVPEEYKEIISKYLNTNPIISSVENEILSRDLDNLSSKSMKSKTGYSKLFLVLFYMKMKLKRSYLYFFPNDIFKKNDKFYSNRKK